MMASSKGATTPTTSTEQAPSTTARGSLGVWVMLHGMLALYSFSSVCSKLAAGEPFMSFKFILFYGLSIVILGVYAVGWQQVIKRLPLTTAYANKAVTLVWGLVWGRLIFSEGFSPTKLIGAAVVLAGVVLFATADGAEQEAAQAASTSANSTDTTTGKEA